MSAPLQASQTSVIQWQRAMETGLRIASSQPVVLLQLTRRAVCSFLMAGVAQNNTFNVAISIRCGLLCKDTAPRGMGLYSYRLIDSLPISALSGIRVKVVSFAIPFQTINRWPTLLSASKLALSPLQACILDEFVLSIHDIRGEYCMSFIYEMFSTQHLILRSCKNSIGAFNLAQLQEFDLCGAGFMQRSLSVLSSATIMLNY